MRKSYSHLINPKELAAHLNDPDWVVFDCRHALMDASYGHTAFANGHIPGARYAHLDRDLSGAVGLRTGRHPLPDWEEFMRWLGSEGVSNASQVVAYDDDTGAFATRLWWMLHTLGHKRAAVLNGGFNRWRREGFSEDNQPPRPVQATFEAVPDASRMVTLDELCRLHQTPTVALLDARGSDRYRGENEPIDPVAGHIPGALNLPYEGNLDAEGVFLSPARLRARFLEIFGNIQPEDTVHYCGSGVSACHNLLAQAVAGLPLGRLYVGSWSQWCADPAQPVETGEATPRS